jgi:hypothetical protein
MFTAGMFEQLAGQRLASQRLMRPAAFTAPCSATGDDHQERRRHHRSVISSCAPGMSVFKAIRANESPFINAHAAPAALRLQLPFLTA